MNIAMPLRPLLLCLSIGVVSLLGLPGCHRSVAGAAKPTATQDKAGKALGGDKDDDDDAPPSSAGAQEKKPNDPDGTAVKSDKKDDGDALHLKPEEVQKLGVVTEAVKTSNHAPEASGFGLVVAHEAIAQSLADLRTALAVARQSQAAFDRAHRLAGTPGAMPLDALETAERQSAVDRAALVLARQRLSSAYGQQSPWTGKDDSATLDALASGSTKLVRVTFPIGAIGDTQPAKLRLGRIGVGQTAKTWESGTVWNAPADNTVPGRSFFAILTGSAFGEGERLLAWTPVAEEQEGVMIPAAAAIIAGGKYWCYVEESSDAFVRTEFDPGVPVSGGYFVTRGVEAGDKVVVKAAGQLLAKELNPSTDAD